MQQTNTQEIAIFSPWLLTLTDVPILLERDSRSKFLPPPFLDLRLRSPSPNFLDWCFSLRLVRSAFTGNGWLDRRTDGRTDRQIDKRTDGRTDRPTSWLGDRPTYGRACTLVCSSGLISLTPASFADREREKERNKLKRGRPPQLKKLAFTGKKVVFSFVPSITLSHLGLYFFLPFDSSANGVLKWIICFQPKVCRQSKKRFSSGVNRGRRLEEELWQRIFVIAAWFVRR